MTLVPPGDSYDPIELKFGPEVDDTNCERITNSKNFLRGMVIL